MGVYTQTQTKMSITEIQYNMNLAFHMIKSAPKTVLLIVDMFTSGSATDAYAWQLRKMDRLWNGVVTLGTLKIKKIYR